MLYPLASSLYIQSPVTAVVVHPPDLHPPPSQSLESLSPHIRPPLHHHPARRHRTHNQRARQSLAQLCRPINQPLQRKVSESDPESPEGDFVYGRVVDVVGAVEADDGAEGRPGAEGAGAQGCD
jgi:hypothetical protein